MSGPSFAAGIGSGAAGATTRGEVGVAVSAAAADEKCFAASTNGAETFAAALGAGSETIAGAPALAVSAAGSAAFAKGPVCGVSATAATAKGDEIPLPASAAGTDAIGEERQTGGGSAGLETGCGENRATAAAAAANSGSNIDRADGACGSVSLFFAGSGAKEAAFSARLAPWLL
jgi:hypothetical protein